MPLLSRLARGGRVRIARAARAAYGLSSFLYSLALRQPTYIREQWPGALCLDGASRIAVFAHFDAHGVVHEFVHHYVQEISRAGFAVIFVSNAPRLRPVCVERLTSWCAAILRRDNLGRDFGAFKDAIAVVPELARRESLLLVNDSMYGPFHDLGQVIGRMALTEADVWGITDSWERSFHLQSFFLLFGRRALASEAFDRFWREVHYVHAKSWIINRYEIGLTRALLADGLRCRAMCPYREAATTGIDALTREMESPTPPELSRSRKAFAASVVDAVQGGVPLNPCHFFWDHLILRMGCPFIKRELLRDNPARVPGVIGWRDVVRAASKYDTDLIARHLEESVRERAV